MKENGFVVKSENVQDLSAIKSRYGIPSNLQSCHTAIVSGYVIEGHVPAAEIERLLVERPDIAGVAVPGMPRGSPGMEAEGMLPDSFDVIAFDESGKEEVFASYPK